MLRTKIQTLVTKLHFKLARMLVNSFDLILLPTFETSEMAKRSGKAVLDVGEAYTSKTASWTGECKEDNFRRPDNGLRS